MFKVLMESNPRRQGRRGGAAASVVVHAGLILVGVWATANSAVSPRAITPEMLQTPVFAPPPAIDPATATPAQSRSGPTVVVLPDVPVAPPLSLADIPTDLPPIEQSLGNPFADTASRASSIDGIVRRAAGLESGSPLDNRLAEKPALPLEDNEPPAYPATLRAAAIEGMVEVEFIIDPNGRMRRGSIVALRADHPEFLEAVRHALATYRYLPAEAGGRAVAVRVRQRFAFEIDG